MKNEFDNVPVHTSESLTADKKDRGNKMTAVRDLIVARKAHIEQLLPKHMDPGRLARLALLSIRKTPKLMECSPESLVGAVIQAAQLGLEPDGTLGQAYLVPYKRECTLQVGYRGMIELARRSGRVKKIAAHVVFENDHFLCSYGLEEKLEHVPKLDGPRGESVAVYAIAELVDGGHVFDVLTVDEIEKARKSSKSANIWHSYWNEMAKKTAIRRLFKYLPISIEVSQAVALDEIGEAGVNQHLDLKLANDEALADGPLLTEGSDRVVPPPQDKPAQKPQDTPETANAQKAGKGKAKAEPASGNGAVKVEAPETIEVPGPGGTIAVDSSASNLPAGPPPGDDDDIPFGNPDTVPTTEPGKDVDGEEDPFALER